MAPPPDDYGWAYIDAQRATASADGPSGSLQFRWGSEDLVPGQFSGSEDLVFYAATDGHKSAPDASGSALYLYGNMYISGAVHAETYTIRQVTSTEVQVSGSTQFGDTSDDTHQRTGSLEVSGKTILSDEVHVANYIRHLGDGEDGHSDTYILLGTDQMTFRAGSTNMVRIYGSDASGSQNAIALNNSSNADDDGTTNDTDFYMLDGHYNSGGTPKFHFYLRGNDADVATNGSLHITASLGPITGSGEIHAARFVSNDIHTSGSVHIGGSNPLAQPDEKNDLVIGDLTGNRGMTIASTATGVGTIRFAGNTNANDGEGWIDYSGNTKKLRIGTDGLNTRMVVDSAGAQVTGSIEASENVIVTNDIHVGSKLKHLGDGETNDESDTYFEFTEDKVILRTGGANATTWYGSTASGSHNYTSFNANGTDTDFFIRGYGQDGSGTKFNLVVNDSDVAAGAQLHISAALGPITGSGEIHAAKFVGNDMWISGAAAHGTGPVLAVGSAATVAGAAVGNSIATINASGSSHALYIVGGMSASHDIKAEHLYVNDLYISGTAHGIVVDRSNYASSSVTTNRTYSPVGFDTSGYLYVSGSSILGSAAAETHQVTGSLEVSSNAIVAGTAYVANKIEHIGDSDTYISFSEDHIKLYTDHDALSLRSHTTQHGLTASFNGDGGGIRFTINADTENGAGGDFIFKGHDPLNGAAGSTLNFSGTLGPLSGSGEIHATKLVGNDLASSGSLTVGTTFAMPDNTAAKILVADGTSYQEVAVSGDVTISSAGAVTIAAAAVENGMVNENVIGSATNIGSNTLAQADELLVYDADASAGARLKAITFSNLEDAVFANVSGDATIADGGALTIAATAVENGMVNENVIGSATNLGATAAQSDELLIYDADASAGGRLKAITISNLEDTVFGNVSGDATIAAGGALTIANDAVEQAMIADDAVGADQIAADAVTNTAIADDAVDTAQIADLAITNALIDNATIRADKLDISNSTDIGAALADGDMLVVADVGSSANRKTELSRIKTYTKTDVSTAGTVEADKAIIVSNAASITGGLTSVTGSGDLYFKDVKATSNLISDGGLLASGSSVLGSVSGDTHQVTGSFEAQSISGSGNFSAKGTAHIGDTLTMDGAGIVFNVTPSAGTVSLSVNDGLGADVAITMGRNGKVTKIGDDTPSDGQYLSWDALGGKVAWSDGTTPDMSGSDPHYSSTELRTSGDLKVSGSVTLGAGATLSGSAAGPGSYLVLDTNNNIKIDTAASTYTNDGAFIEWGADAEIKLQHIPDAGLRIENLNNGDNQQAILILKGGDGAVQNNDPIGALHFMGSDSGGGDSANLLASVEASASFTHASDRNDTTLVFKTAGQDAPEAVRAIMIDEEQTLRGYESAGTTEGWNITPSGSATFADLAIKGNIVHVADTDTAIKFTPNTMSLHAGNNTQPLLELSQNSVVFNEGSNSADFRIESNGKQNAFFIDGADGNEQVLIVDGYDNGGISIAKSGSLLVGSWAHFDGDVTIIGDLTVAGNDIKSNTGNTVLSFDNNGYIDNDVVIESNTAKLSLASKTGETVLALYGPGGSISNGGNIGSVRFYGTETDGIAGNPAQTAYILVEGDEASWTYNSSLGTMMKFAVGVDGSTTLDEILYITGISGEARVGIGTEAPDSLLDVTVNDSSEYVARFRQENASGYGIRVRNADDSAGRMITFSNDGGTNAGHITMDGTTVSYGAFTAYHPALLPEADNDTGYDYGTLVKITSVDSTTHAKSVLYNVEKTTTAQDKAVLGVYSTALGTSQNDDGSADMESGRHSIFAVGDGHILVCSEGGNIETGDYICSSNTAGHGMKQSDDILRNYTVARASEPVDWSTEGSSTKLIACTYHAG